MKIKINFRSGVPIYQQIQEQIIQKIQTGELSPGDQLPPVRQMADDLKVNFNTVARAYRHLDEHGMISTQHGRGTYILGQQQYAVDETGRKENLYKLISQFLREVYRLGYEPEIVQAMVEENMSIWLTDGEPPQSDER